MGRVVTVKCSGGVEEPEELLSRMDVLGRNPPMPLDTPFSETE